jgi:hypothetical protein
VSYEDLPLEARYFERYKERVLVHLLSSTERVTIEQCIVLVELYASVLEDFFPTPPSPARIVRKVGIFTRFFCPHTAGVLECFLKLLKSTSSPDPRRPTRPVPWSVSRSLVVQVAVKYAASL